MHKQRQLLYATENDCSRECRHLSKVQEYYQLKVKVLYYYYKYCIIGSLLLLLLPFKQHSTVVVGGGGTDFNYFIYCRAVYNNI